VPTGANSRNRSRNLPALYAYPKTPQLFKLHKQTCYEPVLCFSEICQLLTESWGPGVVQCLRHCATSRKVPGSIPGVAGVFSVASDSSMCPGVDSASKNEYQVNPGNKDGQHIRLKTYHLHVPMSRNLGSLNSWKLVGLFRPVTGQLYLLPYRILDTYISCINFALRK